MINASVGLISTDILGRLRGGKRHETTVGLATSTVLHTVTKSNICTCLLPTTIIDPSSKSEDFNSPVLPNLRPSKS